MGFELEREVLGCQGGESRDRPVEPLRERGRLHGRQNDGVVEHGAQFGRGGRSHGLLEPRRQRGRIAQNDVELRELFAIGNRLAELWLDERERERLPRREQRIRPRERDAKTSQPPFVDFLPRIEDCWRALPGN
jgi:hypothetical protein